MGWSVSWVAMRGSPAEELWRELGLRPTGRTLDRPRSPFSSVVLDGWAMVFADDDRFVKDAVLRPLSAKGPLVACYVEEHVNHSHAVAWADGSRRWSVLHDEDHGEDHLIVDGDPPEQLAAIGARARTGEAEPRLGLSFFEVPVELAKALVGFRYDEFPDLQFRELEPTGRLARAALRHRRGLGWLKLVGAIALFLAACYCIGAVKRSLCGG